jgi:predicted CoA-substrate-specific enzyme activase
VLDVLEQAKIALRDDIQTDQPVFAVAITGSAGLGLATVTNILFEQEVIAETEAINVFNPEADIIIELGGEDAKITYLHPTPEQRMNGTCAGGTGAFIDQMATLLKTDATGLNALAAKYKTLYPIASRCGVFAKTDLQPLINDGVALEDLAASIFQAVTTQVIAGLACGRPIRGNVIFLGGPLHFLPELRTAFERALKTQVSAYITPDNAELYVCIGAALLARSSDAKNLLSLDDITAKITAVQHIKGEAKRMRALFVDENEREKFNTQHYEQNAKIERLDIKNAKGAVFLGIDAGSTTIKAVLIDDKSRILYDYYSSNEGNPIARAVEIVTEIREKLPKSAIIARASVTGYGEGLIKTAISADEGVVETLAHYEAAAFVNPGVTSIIDIGGQDMKYIAVQNDNGVGVIDSIAVNEACSSGCGSFLETFAKTMGLTIHEFADEAVSGKNPVDLGSRCTVFMNSSVKQAQKEGAGIDDIAAGLCYSVIKNALYKVIKLRDAEQLGDKIVVQGGTFLNDAVLRAFEVLTDLQVVRPEISGLMGAFGAALIAKKHYKQGAPSKLLPILELKKLETHTEMKTCPLCPNKCKMTITEFSNGARFVTGNRCERGGDATKERNSLPNLFEYKLQRTFDYKPLKKHDFARDGAPTEKSLAKSASTQYRGKIGIPRALNMFENYPFWFTLLTDLGFEVVLSRRSDHELFESGMDSIASENICYPAKLVHGHIKDLLKHKVNRIFYPCITFEENMHPEADNDYNCPIVANYPQVIANNMEELAGSRAANNAREAEVLQHGYALSPYNVLDETATHENAVVDNENAVNPVEAVDFIFPYFSLKAKEHTAKRVFQEFHRFGITKDDAVHATEKAYAENAVFKENIIDEGQKALDYARLHSIKSVVLAGRPYHADNEVNHGIPEAITQLNMAVLSEDAASGLYERAVLAGDLQPLERPLRVMDQWTYHSRLYKSAAFVASQDDLQLVQLNSFGCGLDAVTTDQTAEILKNRGDIYTVLKIDEVSNLGAAKIRIRSLKAAADERTSANESAQLSTKLNITSQNLTKVNNNQQNLTPPKASPVRRLFTKEMKLKHKIICPQMHPVPFRLIESVFKRAGFDAEILETATKEDVEVGLKYVNNDACYPAIMVIGQLINAFQSGRYDPDNTTVAISQTGGMCRATNYAALLRLGLRQAGYENIPVLTISTQQLEKHPGFSLGVRDLIRAIEALFIGDMLQDLILRVRPYEKVVGATDEVYELWNVRIKRWLEGKTKRHFTYSQVISETVKAFDNIELLDITRKPRIGVVGEILVKFHPDANNHVLEVIEELGCEAVLPGMMEFMTNKLYISGWNWRNIARGSLAGITFKPLSTYVIDAMRKPIKRAFEKSSIYQGDHKFSLLGDMHSIIDNAKSCTSLGVQAGEGWLLTGEIVELVKHGASGVVCANPFACLPNHVTGRGMFQEIRRQNPSANIVSIDYDPGASEVNQLNRIKLMVSTAVKNFDVN